jgi:hypothetical protein
MGILDAPGISKRAFNFGTSFFSAGSYAGGSNGAAGQIAQAITDATATITATKGATVYVPAGLWDCAGGGSISGVVASLPRNTLNWLRIVFDDAAYLRLSSNIPRLFDFGKVADHDTFNKILIEGGTIDVNNVGGRHHVILGTYRAAAFQTRINVKHLYVRGVGTINVPVDPTTTNHRLNVWIAPYHAALNEATQDEVSDVHIEDCRFEGGNQGVVIGGSWTGGAGDGVNVLVDDIHIERCWHSLLTAPTGASSGANFHVGVRGKGGSVTIRDCYGYGSSDVGVEIDAMSDAKIINTTIEDWWNAAFYHTNFRSPVDVDGQVIKWIDCKGRRLNVTTQARVFRVVATEDVRLGAVEIHNGQSYKKVNEFETDGEWLSVDGGTVGLRRIEVNGLEGIAQTTYSSASNVQPVAIRISNVVNGGVVKLCNLKGFLSGARTGSGSIDWRMIAVTGGAPYLEIDGLYVTNTMTGLNATANRIIDLGLGGFTTIRDGVIRRLIMGPISSDSGPVGINVRGTASLQFNGILRISECDFSQAPGGTTDVFFVTGDENKNKVFFHRNRWRIMPGTVRADDLTPLDRDFGQPGVLAPTSGLGAATNVTLVANQAFLARFVPSRDMTITKIAFSVTTAAGADDACDVGIFSSDLATLLVSKGATNGLLNGTGRKVVTVASTQLLAGVVYYAAFSCGTLGGSAAVVQGFNINSGSVGQLFGDTIPNLLQAIKSTAHPLATGTIGSPVATNATVLLAIRES